MGLTKDLGSIPRAITVSGSNNNVGVSKEIPNAKLDVNGNTIITGSLNVTQGITGSLFGTASFVNIAGLGGFVQGGNSFGAQALIGTNDNQSLALETSGSIRMFISSSGNVGIGTTSPTSLLNVNGQLNLGTSASTQGQLTLFSTTANAEGNIYGRSGGGMLINTNSNAHPIEFGGSRIQFNSNVGIGTTTPGSYAANRLVVLSDSTGNSGLSVDNSNAGNFTTSVFLYGNGNLKCRFDYDKSGDRGIFGTVSNIPQTFWTNNTERMRITSGGNVLIGTTTDLGQKLQINGVVRVLDGNNLTLMQSGNSNGSNIRSVTNGDFRVNTGAAADALVITNNGSVCVGTTSPVGKIHSVGAVAISNPGATFRRALTVHGQQGTYSQVKVIFDKRDWGSVTYDIKLASAGGAYHTAGAYYSNPGFSNHLVSISSGFNLSVSVTAASPNGGSQGATWTFSGATMIHPSLTVDISCGNGYQVNPDDIIVQFL